MSSFEIPCFVLSSNMKFLKNSSPIMYNITFFLFLVQFCRRDENDEQKSVFIENSVFAFDIEREWK